jgi:hypothetical protein
MKLQDKDVKMFESLNKSQVGKWLIDYCKRVQIDLFDPSKVTPENLIGKKEAVQILQEELIDRVTIINNHQEVGKKNEYV